MKITARGLALAGLLAWAANAAEVKSVPPVESAAAPVHWTVPQGWTEIAPTSVRIGNFVVPGKNGGEASVTVTAFPGAVGTPLDNVNRWRGEIGLPPTNHNGLSAEKVAVDSIRGKLYDLSSAAQRTLVAAVPREGATWFFKLRGDKATVAEARPAFVQFLKSVRFAEGGTGAPSAGVLEPDAPNPHAGLPPGADPHAGLPHGAAPETAAEPVWSPPTHWIANAHGMMVVKSYSVPGPDGTAAAIAISTFAGDVGGVFANVNRWRGQLGLPRITQDELPKVTQSLDVEGGKAVLVDFSGKDARSPRPARLVAVMVSRGGGTWFYKMTGDEAVVAREKAAFTAFVQKVRYP